MTTTLGQPGIGEELAFGHIPIQSVRHPSPPFCHTNSGQLLTAALIVRKADARIRDALWNAIGQFLNRFAPQECANYFATAGYVLTNRETL